MSHLTVFTILSTRQNYTRLIEIPIGLFSDDGTSSNTVNNQYLSYDSQGYLYPGTKNHYHSIVSVYNVTHDEDVEDESVTNPYLTPIY